MLFKWVTNETSNDSVVLIKQTKSFVTVATQELFWRPSTHALIVHPFQGTKRFGQKKDGNVSTSVCSMI